jgi:hypothetical protein
MATADVQQSVQDNPAPSIPDYLADPDAVLKDTHSKWRYGRAPDYSKTRKVYADCEYSPISLFLIHASLPCTTHLSAPDSHEYTKHGFEVMPCRQMSILRHPHIAIGDFVLGELVSTCVTRHRLG